MALSAGSIAVNPALITVSPTGVVNYAPGVSGSGLSLALLNSELAHLYGTPLTAQVQASGQSRMQSAVRGTVSTRAAYWVNFATALVGHVTTNAEVTVTVAPADAGLQRTPNPNDPDTATQGPAAPVALATKGTIA